MVKVKDEGGMMNDELCCVRVVKEKEDKHFGKY
jgi:hypothetical protein